MDRLDLHSRLETTNNVIAGGVVTKSKIANIINYIHFQDSTITANFKHSRFGTIISIVAHPLPCINDIVICKWVLSRDTYQDIGSYLFMELLISDGLKLISIPAEPTQISVIGATFILPDRGTEISSRSMKRHSCAPEVSTELLQSSGLFTGSLVDFHANSFCVNVSPTPPQSFLWINAKAKIYAVLRKDGEILYSGDCLVVRQSAETLQRRMVLRPLDTNHPRFCLKENRSLRYRPQPAPNIYFTHPFTGKMIHLRVDDLSGSGLGVQERYDSSVLMVGLVIPELIIELANNLTLRCRGQVIHRSISSSNEGKNVKAGIAFLDIDQQDQVRLSSFLQQMHDDKAYTCSKVDLDSLWEFFFEVGFVYPGKYANMHAQKDAFKATYKKLYIDGPSIARHFTYEDNGELLGHIAMLRAYENTWLFHHLAAKSRALKAGLSVLNQISQYVNNFYLLNSSHMHYVISYYRPDNKFPHKVFGGFKDLAGNPKCCSIDPFAFFHIRKPAGPTDSVPELSTAQASDITEFLRFYEHKCGGLMAYALDLSPDTFDSEALDNIYGRVGFRRERHLFAIKTAGYLHALIAVTVTAAGLNLSNLTNCIQVFVLRDNLDPKIIYASISELSHFYTEDEIPVMVFPLDYVMKTSMPFEKIYNLWAISSSEGTEQFINYLESISRQRIHH